MIWKDKGNWYKFADYREPNTQLDEVLLHMIKYTTVSCMDFPYMSGFRTRVSNLVLKDGLKIRTEFKKGINKFGNSYNYAVHSLVDIDQAIEIYNSKKKQIKSKTKWK